MGRHTSRSRAAGKGGAAGRKQSRRAAPDDSGATVSTFARNERQRQHLPSYLELQSRTSEFSGHHNAFEASGSKQRLLRTEPKWKETRNLASKETKNMASTEIRSSALEDEEDADGQETLGDEGWDQEQEEASANSAEGDDGQRGIRGKTAPQEGLERDAEGAEGAEGKGQGVKGAEEADEGAEGAGESGVTEQVSGDVAGEGNAEELAKDTETPPNSVQKHPCFQVRISKGIQ